MAKDLLLGAAILCVAASALSVADALEAEYSTVKLPVPLTFSQVIYVRNDTIYLFGGFNGVENTKQILRYNIGSDTIEEVAEMPSYGYSGSTQRYDRKIYYFGGAVTSTPDQAYTDIVQFDPATSTALSVGTLPLSTAYHTNFKDGSEAVGYFLFQTTDGGGSILYSCDLTTYEFNVVKVIDDFVGYNSVLLNNYAFIFGYDANDLEGQVLRVDLSSFDTDLVSRSAPYTSGNVPSDGINAYAFGGTDATGSYADVLLKFNLETYAWEVLDVENLFTAAGEHFSIPPSAVFAENVKRIYFFGGQTKNEDSNAVQNRDEIWYIQLN